MFVSKDQLALIGFGFIFIFSSRLMLTINSYFNISYFPALLICLIPLSLVLAWGFITFSKKEWYKELTSYSYYEFNKVYKSYQFEVIQNNKAYSRFVNDYSSKNRYKSIPIDSNGNIITSLANTRNQTHEQIIELLTHREDLVRKYFNKGSFRYSDYLVFFEDFNRAPIKNDKPQYNAVSGSEDIETKLEKVKQEILKYELGDKKPKHMGQRFFGVLLSENIFSGKNQDERYEAWQTLTGLKSKPEDYYLLHPFGNKNSTKQQLHAKYVIDLAEFFYLINLDISKSIKTALTEKEIDIEDVKSYISQ